MTLRAALVIALRFYALTFIISAIEMLPPVAVVTATGSLLGGWDWIWVLQVVAMLVIALFLWALSGRLADRLVRGIDGPIIFQIGFEEGCVLSFVFFGVYFLLKGVAPLLMAFCQYMQLIGMHATELPNRTETTLFRDLWRAVIEFAAGLGAIVGARKWARLVAKRCESKVSA